MSPEQKDARRDVRFLERLAAIINQIHAAESIREIILEMTPRAMELLDAERVTVYAVDERTGDLFSLFKEGSDVGEIRLQGGPDSLAGYVALSGRTINVRDAYDETELAAIDPAIRFDRQWDRKTGFRTRAVLALPIEHRGHVLGVLQLVNKRGGATFGPEDVRAAREIAATLGIAFYNQRRMVQARRPNPFSYLLETGQLPEEKLEQAVEYARINGEPIADVLVRRAGIPREAVLESLSRYYNVPPFIYDGNALMPGSLRERLNFETLFRLRIAPVSLHERVAVVAMEDPSDLEKVDLVRIMHLAPRSELRVGLPMDIEAFLRASYARLEDDEDDSRTRVVVEPLLEETEAEDESKMDEADGEVIQLANAIIKDAVAQGASDIHVEPEGPQRPTRIRFRVDGVCRTHREIPPESRRALVSRLKIMANLDIAERRKPQDGKIRFRFGGRQVELRVATIPTAPGDEDVVMRILAQSRAHTLDELAFSESNLRTFRSLLARPYGIILCVGPTGSGKTTTLHAALAAINTPERKIWTAEDPVEIYQPGLRQVQVHPRIGFDFAAAMRAFLRADPDVIMIGEMRDRETATTAIEASLTGHLVFSTLHTNSAPETISRLLEMEIDPFNFADSLLGVLAQRLVRTLCPHCRRPERGSEEELDGLVTAYGLEMAAEDRILDGGEVVLHRPVGCERCGGTGYLGRMAIHELMKATDGIRSLIRRRAPAADVRDLAAREGMRSLMQDGIRKVLAGHTDMVQVRSVCMR